MTKLTAIFFLSAMLLLQYSRQFTYLRCYLVNMAPLQHCDCEKQFENNSDTQLPDTPAEKHTHQAIPDDFFIQTGNDIFAGGPAVRQNPASFLLSLYKSRTGKGLLRPPRG